MPHPGHIEILQRGVKAWNWWRDTTGAIPDLCQVDFRRPKLERFGQALFGTGNSFVNMDFSRANFREANLADTDLRTTLLYKADLSRANLMRANLANSYLRRATLSESCFVGVNLFMADLTRANFAGANLYAADLRRANLKNATGWQEIQNIRECRLAGVKNAPEGFLQWAVQNGADIN